MNRVFEVLSRGYEVANKRENVDVGVYLYKMIRKMDMDVLYDMNSVYVEEEIYQALERAFGIDCCELDIPLTKDDEDFIKRFCG